MPKKTFDELKRALIEARSAQAASISIDIDAMKNRLKNDREKYDSAKAKRAFAADTLMRTYNL